MIVLLLLLLASALEAQKLHEVCGACHTEQASDFQEHTHFAKGLSCDACHGPSKPHRDATGHKPPDRVAGPLEQPAVCGACHTAQRKDYETSKHGQLVLARAEKKSAACTTCHGTHALRKPAGVVMQCKRCHEALPEACAKPPAAAAARVSCMNCHAQHLLKAAR